MVVTSGNLSDALLNDLNGVVLLRGVAIAELPLPVTTHRPKGTIVLEKKGVVVTSGNLSDSLLNDLTGVVLLRGVAIAALPLPVTTHRPKRTIVLEKKGV